VRVNDELVIDTLPENVAVPVAVSEVKDPAPEVLATLIKSEPFQAQTADSPLTMVTPVVGPTPRSTMLWVLELALMTM
jgi:hypothetical protein